MLKEFKSISEIKKYYDEEINTYVFKEDDHYIDVKFNFDLKINSNIEAKNIKAGNIAVLDIDADDIEAKNIKAGDLKVRDIKSDDIDAGDIDANDIKAWSIKARDIEATNIKSKSIYANDIDTGDIDATDINARDIDADDIDARDINARDIDARDIKAWSIKARNIDAGDLKVRDIKSDNIDAGDIIAGNIKAGSITYYAVCITHFSLDCNLIKGRRNNHISDCLDNPVIIRGEEKKMIKTLEDLRARFESLPIELRDNYADTFWNIMSHGLIQ